LDQELLACIMALKEEIPRQLLSNAEVCHTVDPDLLAFTQGLADIMDGPETEQEKRERIRELLMAFGPSWLRHWRTTYVMAANREVNMHEHFDQCCVALRRRILSRLLVEVDERLAGGGTDEERAEFFREKVGLTKQLKGL
jgi:hypothetical protein